jgi:hypothetical protein
MDDKSTSNIWDPERLDAVGRIMTGWSSNLHNRAKIRFGIEGDSCYPFRSIDDAPVATVHDLKRDVKGLVTFRAVTDTGESFLRNSTSVHPEEVWEIYPPYIDTYKQFMEDPRSFEMENTFRSSIDDLSTRLTSLENIEERLSNMEEKYRATSENRDNDEDLFRKTVASSIRALAGDIVRAQQGESVEFAPHMVDRYDKTMLKKSDDDDDDTYRAAEVTPHTKLRKNDTSSSVHKRHDLLKEEDSTVTDF